MGTAAREPDASVSCVQPSLSQLYFFPPAMWEGEGFAGSCARPAPRSACHAAKTDCAIFAKYC